MVAIDVIRPPANVAHVVSDPTCLGDEYIVDPPSFCPNSPSSAAPQVHNVPSVLIKPATVPNSATDPPPPELGDHVLPVI